MSQIVPDSNTAPTDSELTQPRYIVGLGASAGGLEALQAFFSNMPQDSGLAFVVVQHLSPDYKSLMAELLAKQSTMKVNVAGNGMEIRANEVYVTPPKQNVMVRDGKLQLQEQDHRSQHTLNFPIDTFFHALADDCGDRAIAIVLSGTGSDGTRGVRAIKGKDGMVMLQDLETAKFDGMPRSAASSGVADFILPPEQMPKQLLAFIEHPVAQRHLNDESTQDISELNRVLRLIHNHGGIDFNQYKPSTVIRRIERRMTINQFDTIKEYDAFLRETPKEVEQLFRELLIGVTKFFRDREAFGLMQTSVIPELLENLGEDRSIRVWVPGCSTGEEAFSYAILILEEIEKRGLQDVEVRIFGTDIDRQALDFASSGIYPESIAADVDRDLLEKYFTRHNENYHVSRRLRETVVFAQHNLLKDPPFTKMDIASCRNLLIYIQPAVQRKILSLLHFSLKRNGTLMLGSSESIGDFAEYFETVNSKWKIYRPQNDQRPPMAESLTQSMADKVTTLSPTGLQRPNPRQQDIALRTMLSLLIKACAPECVVINNANQIVHTFGNVNRWLSLPGGPFTSNLLELLPKELSVAVATAVRKSRKDQCPVAYKDIALNLQETRVKVNIRVEFFTDNNLPESLTAIFFEDVTLSDHSDDNSESFNLEERSRERIGELEQELQHTRENLQATIEELETSNEELQATNEELLAANEELQSTNEELHSVNEELYTVNAEYQAKIQELTELNTDLDSLMASLDVGVVVLNEDLTIRRFNQEAVQSINIRQNDIGRPIGDLSINVEFEDLITEIKRVLKDLQPFEHITQSKTGTEYSFRVLPYQNTNDELAGVILLVAELSQPREGYR